MHCGPGFDSRRLHPVAVRSSTPRPPRAPRASVSGRIACGARGVGSSPERGHCCDEQDQTPAIGMMNARGQPTPNAAASMRWHLSHRCDPRALPLANRHYNRQTPDSPQFGPPGRSLALLTEDATALWLTSWREFVLHDWPGAWVNSLFRNEQPDKHLSSELIREAIAATRWHFGPPPRAWDDYLHRPREDPPKARPGAVLPARRVPPRRRDAKRPDRPANAARRHARAACPPRGTTLVVERADAPRVPAAIFAVLPPGVMRVAARFSGRAPRWRGGAQTDRWRPTTRESRAAARPR